MSKYLDYVKEYPDDEREMYYEEAPNVRCKFCDRKYEEDELLLDVCPDCQAELLRVDTTPEIVTQYGKEVKGFDEIIIRESSCAGWKHRNLNVDGFTAYLMSKMSGDEIRQAIQQYYDRPLLEELAVEFCDQDLSNFFSWDIERDEKEMKELIARSEARKEK